MDFDACDRTLFIVLCSSNSDPKRPDCKYTIILFRSLSCSVLIGQHKQTPKKRSRFTRALFSGIDLTGRSSMQLFVLFKNAPFVQKDFCLKRPQEAPAEPWSKQAIIQTINGDQLWTQQTFCSLRRTELDAIKPRSAADSRQIVS